MNWRHAEELLAAGRDVYSELINIVVCVKRDAGLGSLYRSQHELVFVFKSGTGQHTNNTELDKGRNRTNVWRYDSASTRGRKGKNLLKLDPAAKPVQLVMDALVDCSNRGEVVLDSFLGNGTTLLAAERTGRICRGMELDPLNIDKAIRRWQNLTGGDAVRLSDGALFREIDAEKEQGDDSDSKKSYEVGYRKPPVATRFQKGRSGNPSGRPKKLAQPLDPGMVLQSIDNEEIVVIDNGKRKRMRKAEIGFRQLFTKATRGDLTAARLIVRMAAKYFAPEARGDPETQLMGVTEAAQRFGRNWPQRIAELNARLRL